MCTLFLKGGEDVKIFKNRGDIYISKSGVNASKQAKILYILLIFIVIFTAAFVIFLSQRYDSVAEFFAKGEVTVTEAVNPQGEELLPRIEGKTNFLIMETDDAETELHYLFLLQADKDNLAYKAAALPLNMTVDGISVWDIFQQGGGAALQKQLTQHFGFEIDYQVQFKASAFVEFANKLGSFLYISNDEIRFSGGEEEDAYSLHINKGEQKLSGRDINNLLRYYAQETDNYAAENELILKIFTGLLNEKNYENCEGYYRLLVKSANTDITVRDFENGKNALMVYCVKNADITVYSVTATVEDTVLSPECEKELRGYFSKQ